MALLSVTQMFIGFLQKFAMGILGKILSNIGARGGAVWLRHCPTSLKVAGSIPDSVKRKFSLT
jgi:hypothetical protein